MGTGNTYERRYYQPGNAVHPRGHGEHDVYLAAKEFNGGSSPWARGTHCFKRHWPTSLRFIPVGTGNTSVVSLSFTPGPVHPRGHGEHFKTSEKPLMASGSSPWARGTLLLRLAGRFPFRFIPVGTGNTTGYDSQPPRITVHPRGHGEHHKVGYWQSSHYGSSPWARGTRIQLVGCGLLMRFIPVGTGNTSQIAGYSVVVAVHPRGHGEHSTCIAKPQQASRFIPVGTGNTRSAGRNRRQVTVHPRGHGEHSNYRQLIYKGNNSIEKSTRFLKIELSKNQSCSGGKNRTSLNPSTSMGSLLFSP